MMSIVSANSVKVSDNVSDLLSANLLRKVGVDISGDRGSSNNNNNKMTDIQPSSNGRSMLRGYCTDSDCRRILSKIC